MPPTEAVLLSAVDLAPFAEAWDVLAARAIEPNVFLCRWLAGARLRQLPDGERSRCLVAFRGEGAGRQLVGLSLLTPSRGRRFNPLPVMRAVDLYAPLSTPLIAPERPVETWSAMLACLGRAGIGALALPDLAAEGTVASALREAAAGMGLPLVGLGKHRRAVLSSPLSGSDYLKATLDRRRRHEADRQRRRLAEQGRLEVAVAPASGAGIGAALDGFLALEAAGWKGRAGTDLATAPGGAAFFRAGAESAPEGAFRVVSLLLDGRPIAAGIVLVAGRRAFYVKTAYDETLARFSPGLLLTLDLTRLLLDDPAIDGADSVADADHPMIDRLWAGRMAIESMLVGLSAGRGLAFQAALAAERGREAAIRTARVALAALGRRR